MDGFYSIFTISLSLFLLMDPIGNVPIYLSILKNIPDTESRKIVLREKLIALGIILFFFAVGRHFLMYLSISISSVQISGGIILFLIALNMIFPSDKSFHKVDDNPPFIVPLATPLVAGPSVLAAVMIYSRQEISWYITALAILIAWLASTLILVFSPNLKKILGQRGLTGVERLMGLVLTLIAVQMFLEGVSSFLQKV